MSRAGGFLLVSAPCLGPGDLQPGHCVCTYPLKAALQKEDVGALESEALASAPGAAGRRVLPLGRGDVWAGEALSVPWGLECEGGLAAEAQNQR